MDTNFVLLSSPDEDSMSFGETEEQILTAAQHYLTLLDKAAELVEEAPDDLLAGSAGTVYQKKLGLRALTAEDTSAILTALGTDEDRQMLDEFRKAQETMGKRLQNTKRIGLVLKQAKVPYDQMYKRKDRPDLWKPDQMIAIVEVLRQLQL